MPGHKRFSVHPLFFAVGICSAFTGRLLLFLSAALAAVEHECAHAFVAHRYGFALDKIVLMPYGAVVKGDLEGISALQELCVLVAGPLCNACTALFFVALWWLFPETYPYTEAAFYASLSLAAVNVLPAVPLDGGRMLYVLLKRLKKTAANRICLAVSGAVVATLAGCFVYTCFSVPNYSLLVFAILLGVSLFGGGSYERITFSKHFERGLEEKRIAISADRTVGEAVRFLRQDRYLVFVLFDGSEFLGELPEEEYLAALGRGDYAVTLGEALRE